MIEFMKRLSLKGVLLLIFLALALAAGFGCWDKEKQPPVIIVIIDTCPRGT